jgi:hypothetical protein
MLALIIVVCIGAIPVVVGVPLNTPVLGFSDNQEGTCASELP